MNWFYPNEYKALARLAVPIVIGQMGVTLQNIADNVMVGQHSTQELAAVGFVNNLFMLALLLTMGYAMGAISQLGALYAQGRKQRVVEVLKSSLVTDFLQGLLICVALVGLYLLLPYMGQPTELLPLMRPYLLIQLLSVPFAVCSNAYKQFTDSINDTLVAMVIMLIGNVWNILFNWLLIFGHWGFPELGVVGAGWATCTSRILIFVLYLAVFFLRPKYRDYVCLWRTARANRRDMQRLNHLGWPISIQTGMEAASFTIVVVFMGWFGTTVLAAHQVMLSLTNLIFTFYLGVATAVAIRVSNHNGRGDLRGCRRAAFAGWEMILALGVVLVSLTVYNRHHLATLFTDDAQVSVIVSTLILPLILYQLGDGCQVTFVNALRGLGDVKPLVRYAFLAYIVVSIPLSYLFGVLMNGGPFGIWMAFPFGLTTAAILYLRRFLKVSNMKHHAARPVE